MDYKRIKWATCASNSPAKPVQPLRPEREGDRKMKTLMGVSMTAAVLLVLSTNTALASCCGAANYANVGCCEPACCPAPQCCTVMKTCRKVCWEKQCHTCYRTVCDTVYDQQQIDCVKYVCET